MKDTPDAETPRQSWMSLLAKAPEGRATALLDAAVARPEFAWLRPPEVGSVMLRGRAGGTGAPFNLGEMTVTRCSLRLASGEIGHGYVQGRRKHCAEAAALIDALLQSDAVDVIQAEIITPLRNEAEAARNARAAKAAATRVEFFTMARGED